MKAIVGNARLAAGKRERDAADQGLLLLVA